MATAERTGDRITVTLSWNEKTQAEKIPGGRFRRMDLELPLSWGSCQALRGVFGKNLVVGPELTAWSRAESTRRIKPSLALRPMLAPQTVAGLVEPSWGILHPLRPYQKAGVMWMLATGSGLLADEPGTGKTVHTLEFLRQHTVDAKDFDSNATSTALPALVIVPNSTKYHWRSLAQKFLPEARTYVVDGSATQRAKTVREAAEDPMALVIMSIESARLLSRLAPYGSTRLKRCQECDPHHGDDLKPAQCEVHPKPLNAIVFRTVVVDEAHRIKDPASKQTRAIWHLMHTDGVRYRWALTGTPIADHPGDLWSLMHAVAPEDFPVRTKFLERFCLADWNPFGGMDVVGLDPATRDEFFRVFDPRFRRMLKSVVLPQLPPVVREVRTCELTPAMRRTYTEMHAGLATRLEDGTLFITWNDMVKQGRLQQLASASVEVEKPDEDDILTWKVTLKDPSPKLDVMEEILDDLGYLDGQGPATVIAAESRQLIRLAAARLEKRGIPHAVIAGDVAAFERENALDALRQGDVKIVLFTIRAGGAGLDMSAADTLVMLQQPWSMVDRLQTEGRVHRFGSEVHASVRIIDVVTRDTVEEEQIARVNQKLLRLEEITRDREQRPDTVEWLDAEETAIYREPLLAPVSCAVLLDADQNESVVDAPVSPVAAPHDVSKFCVLCRSGEHDHTVHASPESDAARARIVAGPSAGPNPCRPPLPTDTVKPSWTGVDPWHRDQLPTSVQGLLATEPSGDLHDPRLCDVCGLTLPSHDEECSERHSVSAPAGIDRVLHTDATGVQWSMPRDAPDLRPSPTVQKVSNSKIGTWNRCRRQWWLTWYRQLELPEDPYNLRAVGHRVHRALAGWYVPDADSPVPLMDGLETAIREDWEKIAAGLTGDDLEVQAARFQSAVSLERAMVEGYADWLRESGADSGLVFVASEAELSVDIPATGHDGRPLLVQAVGRLDARVVREVDGARLIIDHKTVASLTEPLKILHINPQMKHYGLLEWLSTRDGEARCDGALYNMLRRVKRTAAAKPPFYAREEVRNTDLELQTYQRRMLAAARDMAEAERRLDAGEDPIDVAYPSPDSDCSWKCDFFLVCPMFEDGSRAEDMLAALYRPDDPWARYDRIEGGK
jgi:superfamily II DNA or RNA helicase